MNNKKVVFVPFITILVLMVISYVLTLTIDCNGIEIWRWILSPILVLGSSTGSTTIAILIFLLVIGGISKTLDKCGFLNYMLKKIASKYANKKYIFLGLFVLFLMAMGSLIGSFEEVVPMVPICVLLAQSFGFDAYMGMGMSLLAVGCGFAAGVANPFTVGIAQQLIGIPLFSGLWLRFASFILIYLLLMTFLVSYGKKHDSKKDTAAEVEFENDVRKNKALTVFAIIMVACLVFTISSAVITALQDYTMIIMAVGFLIAGLSASLICGVKGKKLGIIFAEGSKELIPSIVLILMSSSIFYTLNYSGCMEGLIELAIKLAGNFGKGGVIIFMYLIVLIMNMFVPSGSAKAFLVIPLLAPMASSFGISYQLCVLAYAYGDGFSNVFYPTNPALIISLGVINMDYKDWFKFSWKFQALNFLLTSGILLFGLSIGY